MENLSNLKKNIILRIFLPSVIICIIIFAISFILFSIINEKYFVEINKQYCYDLTSLIEKSLVDNNINNNASYNNLNFNNLEKEYLKNLNSRVTIIDSDGKVLFDNKVDASLMQTHFDRKELLKSSKDIVSYEIRTSKTLGIKLFYFSKAIIKEGNLLFFIRISMDIGYLYKYNQINFIFICLFFIFSVSIIYFFTNNYINFLNSLILTYSFNLKSLVEKDKFQFDKTSTRLIFGKKFQNKILNYISNEFENAQVKIKFNEIDLLSHVFDHIDEPTIFFGKNGICLYSNHIAKNLFIPEKYYNHYKEKYYWEIFLSKGMNEAIEKVIETKNSCSIEITINEKPYFLRIIYSNFMNSIFLIFSDISEIKRYYELRKVILSAISHELKTPLTSINGFLEQIILEAENKKDEKILSFAQIAKRNCDRLFNISQDVIEIEKIHYQKEIDLQELDVILEIEQILTLFTNLASTKGISINFNKVYDSLIIKTNKSLFEQILINLIDNAIKYTEKGSVSIDITKLENEVKLIISDTGIGIEEKEIPKIFEPFYCVDKSRSKQKGGTGLGLAIVKSAIERLNAHIEVESIPFEGTKFIVRFKIIS